MRQGKRGLELVGNNLIVEENSPKFNELMAREGKGVSIQIDEPPTQRMAGEDPLVNEALEYLSTSKGDAAEDAAIQDAMEYMRIHNYNKGLAKEVKVPKKLMDDEEGLLVRRMTNSSPAPIVRHNRDTGIERRIHTEDFVNPVTGVSQVVAVENPETGKALLTDFGDGRTGNIEGLNVPTKNEVGDRASEYLAQRVLWLQGDPNARLVVNQGNHNQADFRDGKGRGVDAHTLRTGVHDGKVELQAYTFLQGQQVERAIKQEMSKGKNVYDAVESLKSRGVISGGYKEDISHGKLYKEGYDRLISPLFNRNEALLNVYEEIGGNRLPKPMQDKSVIMPEAIYDVDLNKARQSVHSMPVQSQARIMKVGKNYGNDGSGVERARVNLVPSNKIEGVRDISNDGLVAQLLKNIPYA